MKWFDFVAFCGYGVLSFYFYIKNDKFALIIFLMAIMYLVFFAIADIKDEIKKNK